MQVNKKHADGQSDSSSIGSFLDDTDREVCSLTDRAFKSLCVAELESSYTEVDPVVSPNISHQFSSKFPQGPWNHAIKKNTLPNKGLPKTEEHSTFQQFPNDTQEGQNATINITPSIRMKMGLPVPSLHNYKHTSKVSSLIKTFDKAENREASATAKQPVRNSLAKLPLICGGNMAFWGGKTILNIQKELSEFSEPFQDMANASGRPELHELHRRQNKMDLACHGPRGFYRQADASNIRTSNATAVSRKAAKKRTGKAKEPARKGSFLHSENSAFESWNLHHKKLETGGPTEIILKEGNLTYFEETPFFREARIGECKPSPPKVTDPVISEQDFSGAFPQKPLSPASLSPLPLAQVPFPPQANAKDVVSQVLPPQASDLPPSVPRIPTPPSLTSETSFPPSSQVSESLKASTPPQSLPQASVPPEAAAHVVSALAPVPHVTALSEKANNSEFKSELKNVCPPWRKQKKELGGTELTQEIAPEVLRMKDSSYKKPPDVTPMVESSTDESHVASSDPSSPPFNISKLLTPVLPPKQDREPSEGQSFLVAPPISEAGTAKETEERTLYSSQNNYKSKAPSLLFNLKDIRKRVKSTYSPSPLLRILDDKKIKEQDGMKASVTAANTLEGSNKKMVKADKTAHKPSEQMDTTNSFGHFIDSYLTPEDSEMSSLTDFHPNEHHVRQYSPSNSHLADVPTDLEAHVASFHLQDLKNKPVAPSHSAEAEPQVSPYLFFTPEEDTNDNGNQACPPTGKEHRGKRSNSSSEQSFVSVVDQPFNDDSFSLMQLFQKACHQESQRSKNEWSVEEKLCSKEEEEEESRGEKQLHDYSLSIRGCHTDEKHEDQEEQGKNENAAQEIDVKEKREDKWKSMDSASEAKLEGPLTPTSPSSLKPNMFMIKDNTFKSSPVIKAVKLPLLRSLSCEEAITGSHAEAERQTLGPIRSTPNIQEVDLSLSRNRSQQDVRDAATGRDADESRSMPGSVSCQVVGKSPLMTEYTLREGPEGVYMQELVGEDEGANIAPGLAQKGLKSGEKQLARDKEKARAGKLRRNSSSQPILSFEGDPAQNRQRFPAREKANYFKNNLLSKRRGGSCVKKIISQEVRSPTISETHSHASSDVFRDTSASSGTLTISTIPSPRSSSAMQSAFTSPFSDTSAVSNVPQAEKITNSSSLQGGTECGKRSSALETFDLMQTGQLSGDAGSSPVANERLQMAKTVAKPPAVPPKSEKALRRAKKLASKRKKTEAQQKRLQDEAPSHCGDIATLQPVQSSLSPICLNSSLTPSESHLVRLQPAPSLSPTPSLPATTQRKLLQDPDSGEYFIVDLPVQFKTFYDPESGRYIQLSIPPSKRNLAQTPSSESVPSSYVLYPSILPTRVASVPVQASPSQFSESASLMQRALLESASDCSQGGHYPEPLGSQPYIEPAMCDVHSHEVDGSQYNFEKDVSLPDNADIISMGALEDFAVEGVS
ncbi:cardiac-enriched FHL2-interacting protein [Zootoca vivipara]|uniref:cardiac-enriched FHL2-interacting protein n=1 Tax=Zootoca vivipara TaxID=8524 RepID=UPI00293BDEBD|nr:cardiac-enriched FHL2-interacting protein [Zootoca vivipara]